LASSCVLFVWFCLAHWLVGWLVGLFIAWSGWVVTNPGQAGPKFLLPSLCKAGFGSRASEIVRIERSGFCVCCFFITLRMFLRKLSCFNTREGSDGYFCPVWFIPSRTHWLLPSGVSPRGSRVVGQVERFFGVFVWPEGSEYKVKNGPGCARPDRLLVEMIGGERASTLESECPTKIEHILHTCIR